MRLIHFFLVLLFFSQSFAQDALPIRQWLQERQLILEHAFDLSILENTFRPPWIEKIQMRTETNEFSRSKQEYSMRLAPATPAIRKAQAHLIELQKEDANFYQEELRIELIKLLLEDFLDIYQLDRKIKLQKELEIVLLDQKKLAYRMVQDPDFKAQKLLEIEEDINELQMDNYLAKLKANKLANNSKIPRYRELIDISAIELAISRPSFTSLHLFSDLKYKLGSEIIDAEIELEKAGQRKIIDFVQVRYKGPHDNIFNERVSVGLGIELPFSGSRKTKLEQLSIEQWKLRQEARINRDLKNLELNQDSEQLLQSIHTWTFFRLLIRKNETDYLQLEKKISESQLESPELLLYKKAQQLKKEIDLLNLEIDVYRQYLGILQKIGLTKNDTYIDYLLK